METLALGLSTLKLPTGNWNAQDQFHAKDGQKQITHAVDQSIPTRRWGSRFFHRCSRI